MGVLARTGRWCAYALAIVFAGGWSAETSYEAQAQESAPSGTAEQLAASIALTMRATTSNAPGAPIAQEITSYNNIVESRMIIGGASDFKRIEAQSNGRRQALTRFLCRPERLQYMEKGVAFKYVTVGPDGSAHIDFIVDERSCASRTKHVDSDPLPLSGLAQSVAKRLNATLSDSGQGGLRFAGATADGGVVQVVNVVADATLLSQFEQRSAQMQGLSQGWYCGKVQDFIRRGVKVDVLYKRADGQVLLDVKIDDSVC